MTTASPFGTGFDVFTDVVLPAEPAFTKEFAEQVLAIKLTPEATERMRELLLRNNAGTLQAGERELLDRYLVVGQVIDLLQAKASLFLKRNS